jgi:glycosyltransferase involved in cell wall biosynthesis
MDASIVIPSYNASERLYYNLLALSLQEYPKSDFEVIVVDNGSQDDTWEMLTCLKTDLNLKRIRLEGNCSRSEARNIGIASGEGRVMIFSDSDMIVEKDFVRKHLAGHQKGKKVVCGSNWIKVYTYFYKDFSQPMKKNMLQVLSRYPELPLDLDLEDRQPFITEEGILSGEYKDYSFCQRICEENYKKIVERYGEDLQGYHFPWSFFITNNCSADKQSLYEAGLFDVRYRNWGCEDLDMGYRLYRNGCSFTKKEIESIHQEHPIRHWENGYDNILLFCEKYNACDLLLYYFYRDTPIKAEEVNSIAGNIAVLEELEDYSILLALFREMLCIARDRRACGKDENQWRHRSQACRRYLLSNKKQLSALCMKAEEEWNAQSLIKAFKMTAHALCKLKLDE